MRADWKCPETRHGTQRRKDRAVPAAVIDWLEQFGCRERAGGADRYYFDRRARRRLEAFLAPLPVPQPDKVFRTYAVIADDGRLITAGYIH